MSALRHCKDRSEDSLIYFYKAGFQHPLLPCPTTVVGAVMITDFFDIKV
jgi:hypothetical protein